MVFAGQIPSGKFRRIIWQDKFAVNYCRKILPLDAARSVAAGQLLNFAYGNHIHVAFDRML